MFLLDVTAALEAERLDRSLPTTHHGCVAMLAVGVGRDDQEETVDHEETMGLLAAQPALVRRREVLEQQ